jgi:dTDP-4-amino-4,6-dideoxygalactose transaminase
LKRKSFEIPFNKSCPAGKELEYISQAFRNNHISGDGPFTEKCRAFLKKIYDPSEVFLTTSCTHALEICALLLDIKPGDEVIIPSFSFVSTANAFVLHGARPVFADIRPDTLNIDENKIKDRMTPRTRAVVVVHYAGIGCEMDSILNVLKERNVVLIEDNASGLFGLYRGRNLGTFGSLSTLSFHETKHLSCGEGGALVINDDTYQDRAEFLREKGTNRTKFLRGEVDKYTWIDFGSSYIPSDILAAVLYAQLENWQQIVGKRKNIWNYYAEHLREWAQSNSVKLPYVPDHCIQSYVEFFMLMPSFELRQALITHLAARSIQASFHYLPLHLSPMGKKFDGNAGDCPVTEDVSGRLIRLPFYTDLTDAEQEHIAASILSFKGI